MVSKDSDSGGDFNSPSNGLSTNKYQFTSQSSKVSDKLAMASFESKDLPTIGNKMVRSMLQEKEESDDLVLIAL